MFGAAPHAATMCHCGALEVYAIGDGPRRLVVHVLPGRSMAALRRVLAVKFQVNEIGHVAICHDVPEYVAMAIHGAMREVHDNKEKLRASFSRTGF